MIYSPQFKVVLDANVIYPAPIRDLLLNIAALDLISPKWTELIQAEWIRNLLINRPDLSRSKLKRTVNLMNKAFPDAQIYAYEELIERLELPDEDDKHVLAAAIKCDAEAIITFNKKDFPRRYIKDFEIEVYSPDELLILLNKFSPEIVINAFENQLASLKNPPLSRKKLIETLVNCNIKSATKLFK